MENTARFVINLPERKDRRIEMEAQLRRVAWKARFSHATRPSNAGQFPSIGARGCFESHLAALKHRQTLRGHVLVMEDDLNFTSGFSRLWEGALQSLNQQDWSVFYPAHILEGEPEGLSLVEPGKKIQCAHFFMIHKDAVGRVINGLENIMSRPAGHPEDTLHIPMGDAA
jgi:glycosyl transferase family 25